MKELRFENSDHMMDPDAGSLGKAQAAALKSEFQRPKIIITCPVMACNYARLSFEQLGDE